MLKLKYIILLLLLPVGAGLYAQQIHIQGESQSAIRWMSLEEAQTAVKKTPKPLLIDFYTSWCGWCKRMMLTTYSNPDFAAYINQWFYPVKFNAETRDTVYFRDTMFVNRSFGNRPVHDFALRMLGQQLSYPTTVFITPDFIQINAPGYMEVKDMEPLVVYIVENIFRAVQYEHFRSAFNKAFHDPAPHPPPAFFSMNDYAGLKKDSTKKTLVFIFTKWCIGCKVMQLGVLNDPAVARLLNDHFYLIYLDAETSEPLEWNNIRYQPGGNGNPFHSIIPVLTGGGFSLPAILIFDDKKKRLDAIQSFTDSGFLEKVLRFYGQNFYLQKSWNEFSAGHE